MTDFNIQEDHPSVPFVVKDADGKVVFRDAITFANVTALRNASAAERKLLCEERYQAYLALLATPTVEPIEEVPTEHPEEIPEGQPSDGE